MGKEVEGEDRKDRKEGRLRKNMNMRTARKSSMKKKEDAGRKIEKMT